MVTPVAAESKKEGQMQGVCREYGGSMQVVTINIR